MNVKVAYVFLQVWKWFVSQKSIKGQVIADHLVKAPLLDSSPLDINLPNKDIFNIDKEEESIDIHEAFDMNMYFDGSNYL